VTQSSPGAEPASYKKLSVILPVYDERTTVAEIIGRARLVARDRGVAVFDVTRAAG
jgi:hypothetical protein